MDVSQDLFREELFRGEKVAWIIRWILYLLLTILALIVYFAEKNITGFYGIFLAGTALVYNAFLTILIRKKKMYIWVRYVSVSIDIIALTVYNGVDTMVNSPLAPITTATLLLYPVLLFLAMIRLDRTLIVYATVLAVAMMNILYFIAYPRMDPDLASALVSANLNGQAYRTIYVLLSGLLMLYIPHMANRLLSAQKHLYDEGLVHYEMARSDKLTGLANRLRLDEYLPLVISRTEKEKKKVALFYLDLDGFKPVNDRYGHEAGDLVLCEVGRRLKSIVRETDLAVRVGGDEFVIVLSSLENGTVQEFSERVALRLKEPIDIGQDRIAVSACIGHSIYPDDASSGEKLVETADKRMLALKRHAAPA
jgi:diguanylate cyclase (GGDEF)-like protein